MTHIGTVFIIAAFLLLYKFTGSFDFSVIRSSSATLSPTVKNAVFILSLIGFGTKAGIIPLHVWLPGAHPAAPSHISGLMSGVMIKTGIYMMIRVFLDLLQPFPLWWGIVLILAGAVSALLGVLYALTEYDIKKLLAYSSIENIGIILLGLGSSLTFLSLQLPTLALVGLAASLFHTLNHATFKSLLFLGAGAVIHQTHTRNMEEYGGLIKAMPQTAFLFLVGSMAISALPPFNGFFSEWLSYQTLFQGITSQSSNVAWVFVIAAGALAFTGGLALACFVKAFGAVFLARPRGSAAKHAGESPRLMLVGMWSLGALSLLFGTCSGYVSGFIYDVGGGLPVFQNLASPFLRTAAGGISVGGFATVSAPAILLILTVAAAAVYLAINFPALRRQKITTGPTWDCGANLTPHMEITSTGFSRSLVVIFKGILKPTMQRSVEYRDGQTRYLPKSRTISLGVNDIYDKYLYEPAERLVEKFSFHAKKVQSGLINMYILYILVALLGVLLFCL
jgi:hydrogenase-4 component B